MAADRTNQHLKDWNFHCWKNIPSVSPYCHRHFLWIH